MRHDNKHLHIAEQDPMPDWLVGQIHESSPNRQDIQVCFHLFLDAISNSLGGRAIASATDNITNNVKWA
jgi:hypothetical protein